MNEDAATIILPDRPSEEQRQLILAQLGAFNAASGFPPDPEPVALLLTDREGKTIGGLWGKTVYQWLFVEYLVVPEALRGGGHGRALMAQAEGIARERGCVGAWLTTFPFQAEGFYAKLGYRVFGRLEDSPAGNERIFMRKRL